MSRTGEAAAGGATPGGAPADEVTPDGATAGDASGGETAAGGATPGGATAGDAGGGETAAGGATPGDAAAPEGGPEAPAAEAGAPAGADDDLAALREQRDFLLRSLDDLRREYEAGDVDDTDFLALEDDYTARAARVLRAIEAHERRAAGGGPGRTARTARTARAGRAGRSRGRMAAVAAGVLAFAVLAGVLVAQAAGRRGEGDVATGGIRETTRSEMDEAVRLASEGEYEEAIAVYDEVLADDPGNPEALTFKGWFQFLSGDQSGVVTLIDAVEADPDYAPPHAFLAVAFQRLGRPETALAELDRLDELDPPAEILGLVEGLREQLEAEVAAGGQ